MKNKIITGIFAGTVILLLTLVIASFFYGRSTEKATNEKTVEVTSQAILEKIDENYFVVTKTLYVDQKATIDLVKNSDWSDILWKDILEARATVRIDIGVDMSKLDNDDIQINRTNKTITINLPEAEVLDFSIYGDLEVVDNNGVITSITELFEDETDDYNLAKSTLEHIAVENQIDLNNDVFIEAQEQSLEVIQLIVSGTGYEVEMR